MWSGVWRSGDRRCTVKGHRYAIGSIRVSECNIVARTLLLDLDGTLVDTVPDLAAAVEPADAHARAAGFHSRAGRRRWLATASPSLVARAFAAHGRQPDATAVAATLADYTAHVAVDSSAVSPGAVGARRPGAGGLAAGGLHQQARTGGPGAAAGGGGAAAAVRRRRWRQFSGAQAGPGAPAGHAGAGRRPAERRRDARGPPQRRAGGARGRGAVHFAGWGYGSAAMADGSSAVARDITEAAAIANRLLPAP